MLRCKFLTLRKSDEMSIQAWVAEVRRITFQLQEVSIDVSDEDIILALTLSLPPSYELFIISLDTTPPDQFTLDYVIARLTNEEARQQHGRDTAAVTHQTCLVLWTWRKLADETNAKNTPKIC